LSEAAKIVVAI